MAKRDKDILNLTDKHISKIKENSEELEFVLQALINNKDKISLKDKQFIVKELNRINNKLDGLFEE